MKLDRRTFKLFIGFLFLMLLSGIRPVRAQVSPAEIKNPRLRAFERTYMSQLIATQRAIERLKFPFGLSLNRYVGLDPQDQVGADTRGLEFVNFHDRVVLKVTGNYNAAFNGELLTANQRADRVFSDVVSPILRAFAPHFSVSDPFDDIGVEIAYHVRKKSGGVQIEGKEILAVILPKADGLNFSSAQNVPSIQEVLNRSEVYVDGKQLGLALGKNAPLDLDDLNQATDSELISPALYKSAVSSMSGGRDSRDDSSRGSTYRTLTLPSSVAPAQPDVQATTAPAAPAATEEIAANLEKKYQTQLAALGKEGIAKFHFVDYASPAFALFRNQVYLQLTLRNTAPFNPDASSLYKRAAQTFDLFLAPQLKPILDRVSSDLQFDGVDVTVLNELVSPSGKSSEAIEFACPLQALRQFTNADITNQQLINQSIVLVNGVRIALDLQRVE